jgi:cytochrome c-type biogenesis protein CcmH/NrfG
MRSRFAILIAVAALPLTVPAITPTAHASKPAWLAQDTGSGQEGVGEGDETNENTNQDGNQATGEEEKAQKSQSDPETESGAGTEQTDSAAEETGPPWTYQMARIALVLLALTLVGVFAAYQRFVIRRRRGFA